MDICKRINENTLLRRSSFCPYICNFDRWSSLGRLLCRTICSSNVKLVQGSIHPYTSLPQAICSHFPPSIVHGLTRHSDVTLYCINEFIGRRRTNPISFPFLTYITQPNFYVIEATLSDFISDISTFVYLSCGGFHAIVRDNVYLFDNIKEIDKKKKYCDHS